MWRIAPTLLLPACLWIGDGAHQARKDELDIGLALLDLVPDAWSTCVSDTPEFTVELAVDSFHAGGAFDVWFEVEGDVRREVGAVEASGDLGGQAVLTVPLDLTGTLEALPCSGACPLRATIGVSRLGALDQIDVELLIIESVTPSLVEAWLVDRAGAPTPLSEVPRATNPALGVQAADWPLLRFELSDPYQPAGLGGATRVALCPEGVDPTIAADDCLFTSAAPREDLVGAGDMVFEAATAELQGAACVPEDRDVAWQLHAVVTDHVCVPVYDHRLDEAPLRLVEPDCDGDGDPVPADCDDDDPTRAPGLPETWYDGVDTDCSGGSDHDQDGDGADAEGSGGADCDDLDPLRHPLAVEVCDGRDNDCDGDLATDQITLYSAVGTANFTELDQAIDAAQDGEQVVICPGTYDGNWVVEADLEIAGATGDPADVILRSAQSGRSVLRIGAAPPLLDVSVSGLTLTGAVGAPSGGGLQALGAATLALSDLVVEGNDALRGGGLALAGDATLEGVRVEGNGADQGGGISVEAFATVELIGCAVTANTAIDGAGLEVDRAEVSLDADTEIAENVATGAGGGVRLLGSSVLGGGGRIRANEGRDGGGVAVVLGSGDAATLADLQVVQNAASRDGGGLRVTGGGGSLDLDTVQLGENTAGVGGGGLSAESVDIDPVELTGADLEITLNSALIDGGGLAATFARVELVGGEITGNAANRGGGVFADQGELTLGRLADGVDVGTNAATAQGGGVFTTGGAVLVTSASRFEANTANQGAGLYVDGGTAELTGGVIQDNASTADGGGLFVAGGAVVTLLAPLEVSGNTASGDPQGGFVDDQELEACTGTDVQDPITNNAGTDQGSYVDCFLIQGLGFPVDCDC